MIRLVGAALVALSIVAWCSLAFLGSFWLVSVLG